MYMVCYWICFHTLGMIIRRKQENVVKDKTNMNLMLGYGLGNVLIFIPILYIIAPIRPNDYNLIVLMIASVAVCIGNRLCITQNKTVAGWG